MEPLQWNGRRHPYEPLRGSPRRQRNIVLSVLFACTLIAGITFRFNRDGEALQEGSWDHRANIFLEAAALDSSFCEDPQISIAGQSVELNCGTSGGFYLHDGYELNIHVGSESKEFSKYDGLVDINSSPKFNAGIVKMSIILGNLGYNGRDHSVTMPFHLLANALVQSGAVAGDIVGALKDSAGLAADGQSDECTYSNKGGGRPDASGGGGGIKRTHVCGGDTCLPSVCGDCCFHEQCYGYEYCCTHCTAEERQALGMGGTCGPSGWSLFTGSCDAKYEHYNQCRSTCSAEPLPYNPWDTGAPTPVPSPSPTAQPTKAPTKAPTAVPTTQPTKAPSAAPTKAPTAVPTTQPTKAPSAAPTKAPTAVPTTQPTKAPSAAPTKAPTAVPTAVPTKAPTKVPTAAPTAVPTKAPTKAPTAAPTRAPSPPPTRVPTAVPTTPAPTAPVEGCSKGYTSNDDGVCVRFFGARAAYRVAQALCEAEHSMLAVIHSQHENEDVQAVVGGNGTWIGLEGLDPTDNKRHWVDGSVVEYSNWAEGQPVGPDGFGGKETCGYMDGTTGLWADDDCQALKPFYCEYRCPHNYKAVPLGGCMRLGDNPMNYEEALEDCAADGEGASLASIHSPEMNAAVYAFGRGRTLWIGLNDMKAEGKFVWADGEPVTYTNWIPGEPKNVGLVIGEDCVAMSNVNHGMWHDDLCSSDNKKKFVCYIGHQHYETFLTGAPTPATVSPTVALSQGPTEQCNKGWTPTGLGSCVKRGKGDKIWSAANDLCHRDNAWLVTVDSIEMARFLQIYMDGDPYWIGLNDHDDEHGEGNWHWEDGTRYDWEFWLPYEPNNAGDEDCVLAGWNGRDGRWIDARCNAVYSYVCMYKDHRWTPAPTAGRPTPAPTLAPHPPTPAPTPAPTVFYTKEPLYGSCAPDRCGGCSNGTCWCDATCVVLGDCCADNCQVCGNGCPTPAPTDAPSLAPTPAPTLAPTTAGPTAAPTTARPTLAPVTAAPTPTLAPTAAPTAPSVGCSKGYSTNDDGVCVRFSGGVAAHAVARALCAAEGGALAVIHSEHENEDVWGVVGAGGTWVGLEGVDPGANKMNWVDGSVVEYSNWAEGQPVGPDGFGGKETCGYLDGTTGLWADDDCQALKPYYCEYRCPHNYKPVPIGGCMRMGDNALSYEEAVEDCAADGDSASLISIHSAEMNAAVYSFVSGRTIWIGLNDISEEGVFQWDDGGPITYTNWIPGEPKDVGLLTGEDCTAMSNLNDAQWFDDRCDNKKQYVCYIGEQELEDFVTSAPTIATVSPTVALSQGPTEQCDKGWTPTGLGACVKKGRREKVWSAANDMCHDDDAWLVTVDSIEMARFLHTYMQGEPYWIGLNDHEDEHGEGHWHWEDGTPYDWEFWLPYEPNNAGDEDCVLAGWNGRDDRWVDARCTAVHHYVCMYRDRRWTPAPTAGRPTPAPTLAPHPPTPAPTPVPTVKYTKEPLYGSCTADRCGGCSEGNCWCDETCVVLGDCCEDNCDMCGNGCPATALPAAADVLALITDGGVKSSTNMASSNINLKHLQRVQERKNKLMELLAEPSFLVQIEDDDGQDT